MSRKSEKFFDAVTHLREDLIEEAQNYKFHKKTAVWKYDLSRLNGIDIWLAEYSDTPSYFYDYGMWQYSSKGSVPGLSGNVDMNICFTDFSQRENAYIE